MFRRDYSFTYDDNGDIAQKITDRKDYHYDVWYDYTEPQAVVSKKRWKDAFKELKEQVKRKEKTSDQIVDLLRLFMIANIIRIFTTYFTG